MSVAANEIGAVVSDGQGVERLVSEREKLCIEGSNVVLLSWSEVRICQEFACVPKRDGLGVLAKIRLAAERDDDGSPEEREEVDIEGEHGGPAPLSFVLGGGKPEGLGWRKGRTQGVTGRKG